MGAADFETLTLSDDAQGERLSRWNAFLSDTYAVLRIQPDNVADYRATITRIRIGRLGLTWYDTSAARGIFEAGRAGA